MSTPAEHPLIEFVYTFLFERTRRAVFTDGEIKALEDTLLENPEDSDVMAGTGGVRKSRAANEGRGKSGSGRVAYLYVETQRTVYFLLAFPKNVQGNLTPDQKRIVRALVEDIKREEWPRKRLPHGPRRTR